MRAERSAIDLVTVAAAGLIDLYFGVHLILCLIGIDALYMAVFALAVMTAVTLPMLLRDRLAKRLGGAFVWLRTVFTTLLCLFIASVAAFWCYIGFDSAKDADYYAAIAASSGETERLGADTVIIVFGSRINGYTPGDNLKLRLDETISLLEALPEAICVVSGGQGPSETIPEALAMKHYLISEGIAPERIIMEAESHTTSENIRLTKALLAELNIDRPRVIGVSTAFHLPRIETLASRYWRKIEVCAAPSPSPALYYVSMVREYLSYIKMLFFDKAVISL